MSPFTDGGDLTEYHCGPFMAIRLPNGPRMITSLAATRTRLDDPMADWHRSVAMLAELGLHIERPHAD